MTKNKSVKCENFTMSWKILTEEIFDKYDMKVKQDKQSNLDYSDQKLQVYNDGYKTYNLCFNHTANANPNHHLSQAKTVSVIYCSINESVFIFLISCLHFIQSFIYLVIHRVFFFLTASNWSSMSRTSSVSLCANSNKHESLFLMTEL